MREIRSLTSLRGLAAIYVALLHFSAMAQSLCPVEIPSLAPRGQLAVDFFFDLSGFVMGYTYYSDFAANRLRAMPQFLLKRVARILPLHATVLAFLVLYTLAVAPSFSGAIAPAVNTSQPVRDTLLNLFLLQGLGFAPNFNGPSWSISTEFTAYFAFPLVLAIVFSRSWLVRGAAIIVPVAGLWAISWREPHFNLGLLDTRLALVRTFAGFTLGLVSYRWYAARRAAWLGSDWATLSLAAAIMAIMVFRLGDTFAAMLFPLAILAAAYNAGATDRILSSSFLYFLGVVSYSIYLLHETIGHLEFQLVEALHPAPLSPAMALSLAAIGTASVIPPSWLAYRLIERPGRDAVRAAVRRLKAVRDAKPATRVSATAPMELRTGDDGRGPGRAGMGAQ